jgi:hypothetical protein
MGNDNNKNCIHNIKDTRADGTSGEPKLPVSQHLTNTILEKQ